MGIKTTENGTTLRNRLMKSIVLAIRTLMQQGSPDKRSLDMAAYIVLALGKINETIETAVAAWEKRDYWVKADQFRQEWAWIDPSQTHGSIRCDDDLCRGYFVQVLQRVVFGEEVDGFIGRTNQAVCSPQVVNVSSSQQDIHVHQKTVNFRQVLDFLPGKTGEDEDGEESCLMYDFQKPG